VQLKKQEGNMREFLLGIDIGTTSTKAILTDNSGQIVAESSLPSELSSPRPGWAEEDPYQWWRNLRRLVPVLLDSAGIKPAQVAGIGVSGMVPALILLDQNGNVLRASIQQNDARAVEEIEYQRSHTDERDILARSGSAITQQSIGPKLLWLRRHEPKIMICARHIMGSYDYIVHCLSGEFSAERNWALESGFFDLQREDWDDSLLELAGVNRSWLGTLHWPADRVGELTPQAAKECNLLTGTPVVAGSADHISSAFSAGVCQEGDLLVKLGGAGDILYCLDRAEMDVRLFLDYHVIPGKFLINGCMASSGSLIRWFRDQFAPDTDYAALDDEAAMLPAGSDGLVMLPYFIGEKTPINDPFARGTLIGLSLSHTKAHVYRSILEGIAFGFKDHLRIFAEHNFKIGKTRLTNGGIHSRLWKQITADVLGLPFEEVVKHPGSSLGAAFVAGKGVGVFTEWEQIEKFIKISTTIQPDPKKYSIYQKLFEIYQSTYQSLKPIYPRLSEGY
jgi:xylulokinase